MDQRNPPLRTSLIAFSAGLAVLLPVAGCDDGGSTPAGQAATGAPTSTAGTSAVTTSPTSESPVATPPVQQPTASPAGPAPCGTAGLSVEVIGSDGHAGSGTTYLSLTSTSGRDCDLSGFPVLRPVDATGATLPGSNKRTGTAKTVVLHPRGVAYTTATTSNAPVSGHDKAPCDPPAAAVWLILPSGSGHLAVPGTWRICGSTNAIEVTPFEATRPAGLTS